MIIQPLTSTSFARFVNPLPLYHASYIAPHNKPFRGRKLRETSECRQSINQDFRVSDSLEVGVNNQIDLLAHAADALTQIHINGPWITGCSQGLLGWASREVAHPEGQNEEESEQSLRKKRKN